VSDDWAVQIFAGFLRFGCNLGRGLLVNQWFVGWFVNRFVLSPVVGGQKKYRKKKRHKGDEGKFDYVPVI
jgi:hypothetical protein